MYSARCANLHGFEGYTEEQESGFEPDVREKIGTAFQQESPSTHATLGRWLNTIWGFDHDLVLTTSTLYSPKPVSPR